MKRRKRRIERRLDRNDNRGCDKPVMTASNIHHGISDHTRATVHGGIGAVHLLARKLELDAEIDRRLRLLKVHLPYHESDHVLNIAYNLLAGGTCLEHIELLCNDEAYLDAVQQVSRAASEAERVLSPVVETARAKVDRQSARRGR
ncbi:MAG: hypothetical protein RBS80_30975 [Thermoguttaceae bacterium]|jgi:hypothetical protein|nr:hypothetical protein [Thermoguttaceae bacterium]